MATFNQPIVLEDIELGDFFQFVLDRHGPSSTLVVCSSKEAFIRKLQAVISRSTTDTEHQQPESPIDTAPAEQPETKSAPRQHRWITPTLRLLVSAQTLKLAFCEDVTHLRAYLAADGYRNESPPAPNAFATSNTSQRMLAILNPIALHRPTSNFSAQGLNRTLSIAVDAAHQSGSKLVIAECPLQEASQAKSDEITGNEDSDPAPVPEDRDIWDEEVSILNVATKTFGAGERGWVGRTVKLRTIASRWCVFQKQARTEI